jgi:hypothetical protein
MSNTPHFTVSPALKTVIGLGTFVIAGLMAREASREGIELFEDKVNGQIDKRLTKQQTPPADSAE